MKNTLNLTWKTEVLPLAIILLCCGLSFFFYFNSPELVASHWNFRGEADGYSSRLFASFFFPGLIIGLYILFLLLPNFDPERNRYAEFAKTYDVFRHLIVGVFAIIFIATGIYNIGYHINIGITVATVIGLMMIVLGKYLGKIKKNWFMGIRTPWTMSSEIVWNKTHQVGGVLFMIFGIVIIAAPFLPETIALILFFGYTIVMLAGTFGYSYWLFRQENK